MKCIGFVCCLFFSASIFASPQEQYVTVTGAVYALEPNAPAEMQPAYRDPSGLVWGDIWRWDNTAPGGLHSTSQQYAEAHCSNIKSGNKTARLPTRLEFEQLRESMSLAPGKFGRLWSYNETYNPSKPALPNLSFIFWSQEADTIERHQYAWNFDGGARWSPRHCLSKQPCGFVQVIKRTFGAFTRCVIEL